jgi:hypothetical protein
MHFPYVRQGAAYAAGRPFSLLRVVNFPGLIIGLIVFETSAIDCITCML